MNAAAPRHPATLPLEELLEQCETRRERRSGPGGQHRNKVETAVVLVHRPTAVKGEASERRSQTQNQVVALRRLRVNLALQVRTPPGESRVPSVLWQSRCRSSRIAVSETHDDFPALLAEALDVLQHCDWDLKETAAALAVTTSQLVKFFKIEPRAILRINQQRQQAGLPRFR